MVRDDVYIPYEYEEGSLRFYIMQDLAAESPRTCMSNLGTLAVFAGNYNYLGDKIDFNYPEVFSAAMLKTAVSGVLAYPVIITRNGDQISLGKEIDAPRRAYAFEDHYAWYYVTHETLRKEFGVKRVSHRVLNIARDTLYHEIKILNQWLQGDVYGWVLEEEDEVLDSCWGFYGLPVFSEVVETVPDEYVDLAKKAMAS